VPGSSFPFRRAKRAGGEASGPPGLIASAQKAFLGFSGGAWPPRFREGANGLFGALNNSELNEVFVICQSVKLVLFSSESREGTRDRRSRSKQGTGKGRTGQARLSKRAASQQTKPGALGWPARRNWNCHELASSCALTNEQQERITETGQASSRRIDGGTSRVAPNVSSERRLHRRADVWNATEPSELARLEPCDIDGSEFATPEPTETRATGPCKQTDSHKAGTNEPRISHASLIKDFDALTH